MTTEAGMYGGSTWMGRDLAMRSRGCLRWCVLFLAALMVPEVSWGQPVNERIDHMLWEDVGGCGGAERYLEKLPKGLHAEEARECLEAEKEEKEEMRRRMKGYEEGAYKALERGNVARARQRLEELRKLDEMAPEVMDLEDAIAEAEEKLGTMREYAETGREALGRGDLEKARRFLERLKDAESPLAVELEDAIARLEREPGVYLTVDVLVGQQINSSHLETVHSNRILPDEIRGYSMVRGGCYHRPKQAGSLLGWDDVALGCSP